MLCLFFQHFPKLLLPLSLHTSNKKMTTRDFPAEVLICIFQLLSRKEADQCMLVRKTWYNPAAQDFTNKLQFPRNNYSTLSKSLFSSNLIDYQWVRQITLTNAVLEQFNSLLY
jgi:hypothetical protein